MLVHVEFESSMTCLSPLCEMGWNVAGRLEIVCTLYRSLLKEFNYKSVAEVIQTSTSQIEINWNSFPRNIFNMFTIDLS